MSDFKELIRQVREAASIAELIGEYVPLRRSGKNLVGRCPFPDHNERTPSFNVNEERKIFKCFGCGRGGDIFSFLQEMEGMSFREALQEVAQRTGISTETLAGAPTDARQDRAKERILEAHRLAGVWFGEQLGRGREGTAAREYLTGRGLDDTVIADFRIGYCPREDAPLLRRLRDAGFDDRQLGAVGLFQGGHCPFAGRVIFPILDRFGRIIAFGGRRLGEDGPKYVNSREHPLYRKTDVLYGLHVAGRQARAVGRVIIVEGYMDTIALHAAGFRETVAPLGTALTERHVATLVKLTDRILLFLDADEAGLNAALKVGQLFVQHEHEPHVVQLGASTKDPDEYLRRFGPAPLGQKLEEAVCFIDFLLHLLPRRLDLGTLSGRGKAVREYLGPLLTQGPTLKRGEYARKVTRFLGIELPELQQLLREIRQPPARSAPIRPEQAPRLDPLQRELLTALLHRPGLASRWQAAADELGLTLADADVAALVAELLRLGPTPDATDVALILRASPLAGELAGLLLTEVEDPEAMLAGCLRAMEKEQIDRELRSLEKELRALEKQGDFARLGELQSRFVALSRRRATL